MASNTRLWVAFWSWRYLKWALSDYVWSCYSWLDIQLAPYTGVVAFLLRYMPWDWNSDTLSTPHSQIARMYEEVVGDASKWRRHATLETLALDSSNDNESCRVNSKDCRYEFRSFPFCKFHNGLKFIQFNWHQKNISQSSCSRFQPADRGVRMPDPGLRLPRPLHYPLLFSHSVLGYLHCLSISSQALYRSR